MQATETSAALEAAQAAHRARGRAVPVRVQGLRDAPIETEVFVYALTGRERALRALKMLALCWALALVSVLLPVLHFVLVPLFALLGPVAAWLGHRRAEVILGGVMPCPECHSPFDVGEGAVQWPLQAQCPACRAIVRLGPLPETRAEPPPGPSPA